MEILLNSSTEISKKNTSIDFWISNFVSQKTQATYKYSLREFIRFIEPLNLESIEMITPIVIIEYRDSLIERGLANKTINLYLSSVSSLLQQLVYDQILEINPAHRVKRLSEQTKKIKFFLNDDEIEKLIVSFRLNQLHLKLLTQILAHTAQRASCVLQLKVKDLETFNDILIMNLKIKGNRMAQIPIPNIIKEQILLYIKNKYPEEYLFTARHDLNNKPMSLSNYNQVLKTHARKIGLNKTIGSHSFRRSLLSKMVDLGFPIQQIQTVSKHKNLNTILTYKENKESNIMESPILRMISQHITNK